jgi:hypothetical protein
VRYVDDLLKTSKDLHGGVEVAHTVTGEDQSDDAGEHRFAVLVRRLIDDDMCDPTADL